MGKASSPYCVNVSRDWNFKITEVTPSVEERDQISSANQKFNIDFEIKVDRDDTGKDYVTDPDVTIIPITYVIEPGADVDTQINPAVNGGEAGDDLCGFFSGKLGDKVSHCRTDQAGQLNGGSGNGVYGPSGSSYERDYTYSLTDATVPSDLDVGAKFCVAIAIKPLSSSTRNSGMSFISRSTCTNVSKRPAVHVWGGTVQTNGNVATSLNQIQSEDGSTTETYGSWTEFALIARGTVKSMASGAGLVGGLKTSGSGKSVLCQTSALTIANSQCRTDSSTTALGNSNVVGTSNVLTELKELYINPKNTEDEASEEIIILSPKDPENPNSDTVIIDSAFLRGEDITDKNDVIATKKANNLYIAYSSGDLVISGDISYGDDRFSGNVIPQFIVIVDGDINITGNVSRIDAWLVAGGTIDTCYSDNGVRILTGGTPGVGQALLSSSVCTNQLHINGPVVASKIDFKRTANGDRTTVAAPAEIVNYSAFSILFGTGEMTRTGEPQVTYIKTLAPRY